jgi:hypothetical protein
MNRKLRMGMVGGGKDAFIGSIHRLAANMDGLIEIVAGALSINPGSSQRKWQDVVSVGRQNIHFVRGND